MALADWIGVDMDACGEATLSLEDDYVFEGSRSLRVSVEGYHTAVVVHKQTINDAPVSGALKTAFLWCSRYQGYPGAVFKFQEPCTGLVVYLRYESETESEVQVTKWVNGSWDELNWESINVGFKRYEWYIMEIACDDENNTITFRLKDANENVLGETAISGAIPDDFKGVGGGIGLSCFGSGRIRFDLTKIYYP